MNKVLILSLFFLIFVQALSAQPNKDLQIKEQISEIIDKMSKATSMEEVKETVLSNLPIKLEMGMSPYLLEGIKNENSKIKYGCYIELNWVIYNTLGINKISPYKEKLDFNSMPEEYREPLKEILQIAMNDVLHSPTPEVRAEVAAMLPLFGGEKVISVLQECLKDPDLKVRDVAIGALSLLGHKISRLEQIKILTGKEPRTPEELTEFLGEYDELGLNILARGELRNLGEKSIPALLKVVAKEQEPARTQAINILGDLKAYEAVPILTGYLKEETTDDTTLSLQITSAYSLEKIASKKAIQSLVDNGLTHENLQIQLATAEVLIPEHKEIAVPFLLDLAKNEEEDNQTRFAALQILTRNKQKEAIPVLIGFLDEQKLFSRSKTMLENATGQNFGRLPPLIAQSTLDEYKAKWKNWWQQNKDTFQFPSPQY